MFFARLVVQQRAILREVRDERRIDPGSGAREADCHVEQGQSHPRVAVRIPRHGCQRVVIDRQPEGARPADGSVTARERYPARCAGSSRAP